MALCQIEEELVPSGQVSRLMQVLDDTMLAQPKHWAKHYPGSSAEQRLLRRYGLSDRCRYYWGEAPVLAAVEKLVANLDALEIPLSLLSQHLPEQYLEVLQGQLAAKANALLEHKIGRLLAQYARACNRNAAADASEQAGAAAAIC
jgi:D-tagatose-1,6-bisphosphate aldolase subunit GatZ/KbaZ